MATEAFLICEKSRVAYNLGKFLGTWTAVDWTATNLSRFTERIRVALPEHSAVRDLAAVLWRFCEAHAWRVRVVHEDFFFDEARLDYQTRADVSLPEYRLVGSRWPSDPPMGFGYDLPDSD